MIQIPYEIYSITSDAFWYVGSASGGSTAQRRWQRHKTGWGHAEKLYGAIQEHGEDEFLLTVLECGEGDPIEAERRWYDRYLDRDARESLNLVRPASAWHGPMKFSPEARAKISATHKGKVVSLETRAKLSAAAKARPSFTVETRIKMSTSHQGKTFSPETRAKLSVAGRGNTNGQKPRSLETRTRMSEAAKLREAAKRLSRKEAK